MPELRFPESKNSGAWKENGILNIASMKARIGWQNLKQEEHLEKGEYFLVTGTDFLFDRIDWNNVKFISYERYM